jgi:uncharacterized membrane protein YkvI
LKYTYTDNPRQAWEAIGVWASVWRSVKISMTIVGTTIGAGFASGREIWEFFGAYGDNSRWGIVLSMVLFFLATVTMLQICWYRRTQHYSEMLMQLMDGRLARFFDGVILLFLLTGTLVMVAGSGATFEQWNGSYILGGLVLCTTVFLVLLFDLRGVMTVNALLMPVLTFILLLVCSHFLQTDAKEPVSVWHLSTITHQTPLWSSAITYAAFNIISLLAVLSTLGSEIRRSSEIWLAAVISSVCLGAVAYLYNMALLRVAHLVPQYDIPLFALMRHYSPWWMGVVSLVLWLAIFTTAVSNVHGLISRLSDRLPLPRWMIGAMVLIVMIPLSRLGFAALIHILYPLYGVLNLFILMILLLHPIRQRLI